MRHLSIEQSIVRTIIFFDLFEYPLTPLELWKNLFFLDSKENFSLSDCVSYLSESSLLSQCLEERSGYYFLKGRTHIVDLRLERAIIADRKYTKALRITKLLASVPFVRMVCVCNTLGLSASPDDHDIDFFIVGKRGHVWFVRLLCIGVVKLCGKRPQKNHERDTFCLSFYAADNALDLSSLQIPQHTAVPDIYLMYWTTWCVPLYDDHTYEAFTKAQAWIGRYIPNRLQYTPIQRRCVVVVTVMRWLKRAAEGCIAHVGSLAEYGARTLQYRIGSAEIMRRANKDTSVVMNDGILKFHLDDRREEIRGSFLKKCEEYNV